MARRTDQQRKAIEVYCNLLAEKFNEAGHDKVAVLSKKVVKVQWTQDSVKEDLFKAIMKALFPSKVSTTELSISEVNTVYEALNQWTDHEFNIFLEFPSEQPER